MLISQCFELSPSSKQTKSWVDYTSYDPAIVKSTIHLNLVIYIYEIILQQEMKRLLKIKKKVANFTSIKKLT